MIIPYNKDQKLNLLNIIMIQIEHGINIDHTYHIIKNNNQEYLGTKTKHEVKFQKTLEKSFENELFMDTYIIEEELGKNETHMGVPSITGLVASCKSLSKTTMIFNILQYISVSI